MPLLTLRLESDDHMQRAYVRVNRDAGKIYVLNGQHTFRIVPRSEQYVSAAHQHASTGRDLIAPYPGLITEIAVKPGDRVSAGDTLVVMEAMKMIQHLTADGDGVIKAVHCRPNQSVETGRVLIEFEKDKAN